MFTLLRRWYQRHFSQPGTIEFALVLICAFLTVYYLMWLVGPIVVALCIAFILDWPVESLQRNLRMSRHFASIVVMILFCSIVISITVLVVPKMVKQGAEFYNSIVAFSLEDNSAKKAAPCGAAPAGGAAAAGISAGTEAKAEQAGREPSVIVLNGGSALNGYTFTIPGVATDPNTQFTLTVSDFDMRIAHELNDIVLRLPEPIPSMLTLTTIQNNVRNIRVGATNKIADLMRTQLMPSVVNAFTWLVYVIIVPIFTFLMLYNKQELQDRVRIFILPTNQQLMRAFWPSVHQQIAGYIRGKLLHIIIIAIANTLAFMLMGVNYALLLGVGVGLSVVIPYVGAVIIAVPVVLVAIFQFGFSTELLWVLVIYTVIQLLDSNVLTPMLFSKAMNLDAFSILAAILIFGTLWGFWGVFFAIPLATFIKTLITRWPDADELPHPEPEYEQESPAAHAARTAPLSPIRLSQINHEGTNSSHKPKERI